MEPNARNGQTLLGLSFAITDDLDAHSDRRDCVDASVMGSERISELAGRRLYTELPPWATSNPIPLNRQARHFEPLFEGVSDQAFASLSSLLGPTIESSERFQLRDARGQVYDYHRVFHRPHLLQVDWDATNPRLTDVDTSDNYATRKVLRRAGRTVLALRDVGSSTHLHQLTHLSMYPLVTERFVEAWRAAGVPASDAAERDGPYFLRIATQRVDYRWV